MIIKGYIAVNEETLEVLNCEEQSGCEFSWVFESKEDLCGYVVSKKLKLEDYVIHYVEGEVLSFEVNTTDCCDY